MVLMVPMLLMKSSHLAESFEDVLLWKVDGLAMAYHASASLEQHVLESLAVNVAVSLILPAKALVVEEESVLQV